MSRIDRVILPIHLIALSVTLIVMSMTIVTFFSIRSETKKLKQEVQTFKYENGCIMFDENHFTCRIDVRR